LAVNQNHPDFSGNISSENLIDADFIIREFDGDFYTEARAAKAAEPDYLILKN